MKEDSCGGQIYDQIECWDRRNTYSDISLRHLLRSWLSIFWSKRSNLTLTSKSLPWSSSVNLPTRLSTSVWVFSFSTMRAKLGPRILAVGPLFSEQVRLALMNSEFNRFRSELCLFWSNNRVAVAFTIFHKYFFQSKTTTKKKHSSNKNWLLSTSNLFLAVAKN